MLEERLNYLSILFVKYDIIKWLSYADGKECRRKVFVSGS